jgi:hypothetical protein
MTRWFVLPRFGSCKSTPRWGGHKDRVSFNPFPLSNGHLDRVSLSLQSNGTLSPLQGPPQLDVPCFDYKWVEHKKEGIRKAIQAQELTRTQLSLSLVTIWLEWSLDLGEDLISCLCLVLNVIALVWDLKAKNLDAMNGGWLGVFITPTTKIAVGEGCCRMAHRTVGFWNNLWERFEGWCHCLVRQPCHPAVGFWPLELLTAGPPDSLVVHWTVTVHCPVRLLVPVLTSARAGAHCSAFIVRCRRPFVLCSHYSAGTPDIPVLHRTVRWIIAERLPEFPKVTSSESGSLVHRTLYGGTPDSPVRQTRAHFGCLLLFLFEPFLGLFIGLWWTFGTCRTHNLEQTS